MSSTVRRARWRLRLLGPLVLPAALTACAGPGAVEVAVPEPTGDAAEVCRDLHERLPEQVQDEERRSLAEESPYAAAWGDPATVLRCGVARPEVLDPDSERYDPAAHAVMVDDVTWLIEEEADGHRFTSTERVVRVEVFLPDGKDQQMGPLVDVAEAVTETVPLDPLWEEYYDEGGTEPEW